MQARPRWSGCVPNCKCGSTRSTGAPMTLSAKAKAPAMVSDMPLPLRAYRALSGAVTPLAGTIARQRLKRGKEDAARIDERRGIARVARPPGPLVWLHGASVGEGRA